MQPRHDVVCPTLVGRDRHMAALGRVLDRVRGGNGQVALIVGEAGVGKSRLLRAMTDEARASGCEQPSHARPRLRRRIKTLMLTR